MGLPFGGLGASLDFARIFYFSVLKTHFSTSGAAEHPFEHIMFFFSSDAIWEARCLLFDISGPHFCTLGASWRTILAPREHLASREHLGKPFWRLGIPWEQQDGREVANNRIFVDFEMISGLVYVSLWDSKCLKNRCIFTLVSRPLVHRFLILLVCRN